MNGGASFVAETYDYSIVPECARHDLGHVPPDRSTKVTYIITSACVDVMDRTCIDECPVDCIYEGERMSYIHPDECVDCGACEPVCPVDAIYFADDLPGQQAGFYRANAEFFTHLGSPGGASVMGKIHSDHPMVAALPPQPR
jgi:NAD-dependent dihydropyrimidine dehydrogenase PreA subunit